MNIVKGRLLSILITSGLLSINGYAAEDSNSSEASSIDKSPPSEGIVEEVSEPSIEAAAEPVVAEPVVAEPVVAEPVVAEPVVAEPVVAEPVVAEPVVTEPVVTEPVVTEPVVTEPVVTEPVVTEPVVEPAPVASKKIIAQEEKQLEVKPAVKEQVNSQSLDQLEQLIAENKFTLAYQMGLSLRPQWEGEEQFDFNFALAAAQTGHYNQAIFPFERLLDAYPNNARFRLELARCHYFLNNLNAAEHEFNQVAASKPPADVQKHINRFLTRIAEKKQQISRSWSAGAGLALGYDSNINAAADLDSISITLPTVSGVLNLDDEQKSKGSAYYQLQGFGQYQQPLSKRTSVDFSASLSQKDNTIDDTYDLTNLSLNGGFRMLRSNHNLRFGGVYRQYWLAGDSLQNQLLGNVRWQWYFAPQWKITSEFELGQQDNDQNDALDFTQWQAKASLNRKSEALSQSFQLGYGSDIAAESSNDFQGRNYLSIGYQMQQEIAPSQQVYALVNYRNNSYADAFADDHIFFARETREDQLTQLTAGWLYNFMKNTSAKVQLSHSQNQSNLELYDYQRTLIEAGLTISFK